MIIDTICTAMPRPKIHETAFKTYTSGLKGVDWANCTLFINIDPFPYTTDEEYEAIQENRARTIIIARKYFGNVVTRTPKKPNYTKAYNWLYSSARTTVILNLEDDWALNRNIDIRTLIKNFEECGSLYEVVLRAYTYRYPCTCTSPALLHKRYYGAIAGKLDPERNPETQTHSRRDFGIFIPNKKNCPGDEIDKYVRVYPEKCGDQGEVVSIDIGREWLDNSPYMRPQMLQPDDPRYKKKDKFRTWITRPGWSTKQIVQFIKGC